jgi:hypothetical protein
LGHLERSPGRVLRVMHVEYPFCGGVSRKEVEGCRSLERVVLHELGAGRATKCFDDKDGRS